MSRDMTKIDGLVARLSSEDPRPSPFAPTVTVTLAAILALAVVLMVSVTWLEPRANLVADLATHNYIFALKLIFTVSVVAAVLPVVRDLSVPGRRIKWSSVLAVLPFAGIMALALHELARMPVSEWSHHVGDASWLGCLLQIPALAIPAFIILALAVRRLAPTNLTRAGAYVGLLAGGIAAVGYALHCHDDAVAFVAISYTLAMLEMTFIGAIVGPRILRWN
jgi:hypothetical protein